MEWGRQRICGRAVTLARAEAGARLSPRLPPRHDPFVLALVTRGARRDDPASERDAGRTLRTHAVATPGVCSRAAGRIGIVVGAVHHGEAVGALVAYFNEVLRHGDPLA